MTSKIKDILKLIRPHQWVKNSFVFIGIFFGHKWQDWTYLKMALLGAVAFSLVASGVYILNDLVDRERDRAHPKKFKRPLASGRISIKLALVLMTVCFLSGFGLGQSVSSYVMVFLILYTLMNIAYSFGLKHVVILDVFIISTGFMLRILTGTSGIGIMPSSWLLFCGLMITLFLGFSKRRAELLAQAQTPTQSPDRQQSRQVLEHYNPVLLDLFIAISLACAIMSYSLYTVSPHTIAEHGTASLIYTIPFVIYACFRYIYLIHLQGGGEDTARDLVRDPHIIISIVLWGLVTFSMMMTPTYWEQIKQWII